MERQIYHPDRPGEIPPVGECVVLLLGVAPGYDREAVRGLHIGHGMILHRDPWASWYGDCWTVSDYLTGAQIARGLSRRGAARRAWLRMRPERPGFSRDDLATMARMVLWLHASDSRLGGPIHA